MIKCFILSIAITLKVATCNNYDSTLPHEIINMPPADSSAFMIVEVPPVKTKVPDTQIKPKFKPQKILKIVDSTMDKYASDSLPAMHEEKN